MNPRSLSLLRRPTLLVVLAVVATDLLVNGAAPGLNAAVLAALAFLVLALRFRRTLLALRGLGLLAFTAAVVAALALQPRTLSIALAAAALVALALVGRGGLPRDAGDALGMLAGARLPLGADLAAIHRRLRAGRPRRHESPASPGGWLVAASVAGAFAMLFLSAGPVFAMQLDDLARAVDLRPERGLAWIAAAAASWTLLRVRPSMRWRRRARLRLDAFTVSPRWRVALARTVLACNLVFVVQVAGDAGHVLPGEGLPFPLTLATSAQRGAHLLLIATLLSAAIVLLTGARGGPWHDSAPVRGLVEAWLLQDVLLVAAAGVRLHAYVAEYALTRTRAAAFLWMALVAAGLVLVLWRLVAGKDGRWLFGASARAAALVLLGAALLDDAGIVSRFNDAHSRERTRNGALLDVDYLATLGPGALPGIVQHAADFHDPHAEKLAKDLALDLARRSDDWRSLSLRDRALIRWSTGTWLWPSS